MPVYNEEDGIAQFNQELWNVLYPLTGDYIFEVIYVVDKSKDNTLEKLMTISDDNEAIRIIALSRRFGHQMSLVAGLDECTGIAAIMMDCDLEHPPQLIPVLLKCFEEGFDVVNTNRIYNQKISIYKKFSSALYYRVLYKLAGEELGENSADFRLVSRNVINVFKNSIREHNQYLRGLFHWVGFNQTTVSFTSGQRVRGVSKYTISKLINFAGQGIISFSKIPLKMSIGVGVIIALASIIYGIYAVLGYFLIGHLPPGWSSTITLIGITSGFQLIVMGIIGMYIGAIFDETKNRPLYVIEFEYGKKIGKRNR